PRSCCADPLAAFRVYPEPLNHWEDASLLPFMAESCFSPPRAFPRPAPRGSDDSYGPAFLRKRNERERQRVRSVNEGYARLRHHLPKEFLEKRLSKVETLRAAIRYIGYLQALL
ncbi:ASCL3 protein, partial [Alcedo cyanopectus]|nr:ASCL3 protein [Ceyx cyanopectus]